ncbi:MAG: saccharopine dehydrogenase C-terminal domain-containing protein [Candidatus Hermodarchaeia archaeon]|jgi:saccharopine dehydrogenase-like NADP-dependent oxidoreductase
MKKVLVLGAGLMGVTIAKDLANEFSVTLMDNNNRSLDKVEDSRINCISGDIFSIAKGFCEPFDIVVGALPGSIGYDAAQCVLHACKDYVDISFAPEDLRELSELAWAHGARCIMDFGVAPGLSHLIFGYYKSILSEIRAYHIYVGGLLKNPDDGAPWFYKAPFSPADVIEEYTRPARYISKGEVVTAPAMSNPEISYIEGYGGVEAFLTDGVRTLLSAKNVDSIVEKTIRPPGYRDRIQLLMDSGFFGTDPVLVGSQPVRPRDLTEKLLIDSWRVDPDDQDMTFMKVIVKGTNHMGFNVDLDHYLIDYHDGVNSSMARTTGFMCTAGVRLLANGLWKKPGVFAPEDIGENQECFKFVMEDLGRHDIRLTETQPLPKRPTGRTKIRRS